MKPVCRKRKLFHFSEMPCHFNALTDLRFFPCHLCFMFQLLYPVPSFPVSSRNDSDTPRACPSSLFSTLMCCYRCLLQTDSGRVGKIWQALSATYFTWGRQPSAEQNWFLQNICTLKAVPVVPRLHPLYQRFSFTGEWCRKESTSVLA